MLNFISKNYINLLILTISSIVITILGLLINLNKKDIDYYYNSKVQLNLINIGDFNYMFDNFASEEYLKKIRYYLNGDEFSKNAKKLYDSSPDNLISFFVDDIDDEEFEIIISTKKQIELNKFIDFISKNITGFFIEFEFENNLKKFNLINNDVEEITNDYLFIQEIANEVFNNYLEVKEEKNNNKELFLQHYKDLNYNKILYFLEDELFLKLHDRFISNVYESKNIDEFIEVIDSSLKSLNNEINKFIISNYTKLDFLKNYIAVLTFYYSNFVDIIFTKNITLIVNSIFERNFSLAIDFEEKSDIQLNNLNLNYNPLNFVTYFYFLKDKKNYLEDKQINYFNNLAQLCDMDQISTNYNILKNESDYFNNSLENFMNCKNNKKYFYANIDLPKNERIILNNIIKNSIIVDQYKINRTTTVFTNKLKSLIFYFISGLFFGFVIILFRNNFISKN